MTLLLRMTHGSSWVHEEEDEDGKDAREKTEIKQI